MALRNVHLAGISNEADDAERVRERVEVADSVVQRILDRVQAFDHSFGRNAEPDG